MEDKKCKLKIVNNQLSIDNLAQRGVTLVELIMTMVMSSIVLISIYVIVSKSHEYIIDAKPKIQLQQDFSLKDAGCRRMVNDKSQKVKSER